METGPHIIHTQAYYKPDEGRFHVTLSMLGDTHIEIMDLERWNNFIDHLDEKIVLGGYEINLVNDTDQRHAKDIKDYLRRVDKAYRIKGSTDYLPAKL